ncbi:MAG: ABC transporter ATP-binding protein, partial [Anaerolineae bacterium]|nr:ABC transporter ATP-binding protein [Anaerolineae bacterium]
MTNAIEVQDLTKYYGDPSAGSGRALLAVDHINFEVHQGEIFGFLGPNGAGKTTTQRMLTTLLEPTEGRIVINGHDLAHDAYPVKRQMGLVPEESNVYTELTAWDNLMFTARLYRVGRDERAERAQELLETFGLWEKRDVKVQDFSKGMRRRLSIAMAIIHQPKLLFLDEPTPGLDAQSARAIRDLIRQLNAEGTTIFLSTHQIEEANQLCDRVAIINHGQI